MINPMYTLSDEIKKFKVDSNINSVNQLNLENKAKRLDFIQAVYVLKVFERSNYNASRTAKAISVSRSTFYRMLNYWLMIGYIKRNED